MFRGEQTGQMNGVVRNRCRWIGKLAVSCTVTVGLASLAVACGADGPEASGRGAALYQANCAACHGAELEGSSRGPSLLDPMYVSPDFPDAEIADAIRNGVDSGGDFGAMEAIGRLSDEQIALIIAFIREQQGATIP